AGLALDAAGVVSLAPLGGAALWGTGAMVLTGAAMTFAAFTSRHSEQDRKKYSQLAYIDELTGLPNRRQFNDQLEQEISRAARHGTNLALMYFDLDQFKAINDCYGHEAGDQAIKTFGERIKAVVRCEDLAARLSGDEFAVIATEVRSSSAARQIADRVFKAMAEPIIFRGKPIYANVSVGAAVVMGGTVDAKEALRRADLALLQAKAKGRNRLQIFDPEMAEALRSRKILETDLREAVRQEKFFVAYQPLVSHDGDSLHGVEALVRWTHPGKGSISPAEFIPVAEDIGLINEIGEFVLRRACLDIGRLEPIKLAVNVSPIQFRREDFVETVQRILMETGFDPNRLELEITEGIFISDPDETAETIRKLRAIGVRIALDDFGTGYSSMSYLREFRLDRIKIDRTFVDQMGESQESRELVAKMIELGSALGLSVTAEGVETEDQARMLKESGCQELQGYLFSRPISAEELAKTDLVADCVASQEPKEPPALALVS
ncbi:MAG: bifunctional diguanylate cyclase/phosphodiesterase, partial [Pseudomonadota bacterium]